MGDMGAMGCAENKYNFERFLKTEKSDTLLNINV